MALALGDCRCPSLDSVIMRGQMVPASNHEPLPAAFAGRWPRTPLRRGISPACRPPWP